MNAIWGAHMLSLTKLIVVVDADCDVHDYSRGRLAGARQRRLRPRPAAHRGPGRPPRPRVVPAVLGRQGGHRRDPQAARRRATRGTAAGRTMVGVGPGDGGAGRPAAGRSTACDATAADRRRVDLAARAGAVDRSTAGRVRAFLRLVMIEHSVFALPFAYIAALTAMFRAGPATSTGGRCCWSPSRWSRLRTFAMAANRIIDREIDARNPRTAAARAGHRRGVGAHRLDRRARRRLAVFLGAAAAAQPALPGARAGRGGPAGASTRTAKRFTELPARDPRPRPGDGARSAPGSRSPARGPGTR